MVLTASACRSCPQVRPHSIPRSSAWTEFSAPTGSHRPRWRCHVHDQQDPAHADVEPARAHDHIWWQKDPAFTEDMAVGGPVQHDPCQVAFHSPAGRLPTRLIPARRRRPATCARRQQTMVLPRPSRGLVRHAPTVASQAPSDPAPAAPTHARWFSAPETIDRCLSVDQG